MSYCPPWHGQPKPDGFTGIFLTPWYIVVCLNCGWPFGSTGQPRWAQWFEMIVKLGWLPRKPLLRMNAVRRDTSPSGLEANVVTRYSPSG